MRAGPILAGRRPDDIYTVFALGGGSRLSAQELRAHAWGCQHRLRGPRGAPHPHPILLRRARSEVTRGVWEGRVGGGTGGSCLSGW